MSLYAKYLTIDTAALSPFAKYIGRADFWYSSALILGEYKSRAGPCEVDAEGLPVGRFDL